MKYRLPRLSRGRVATLIATALVVGAALLTSRLPEFTSRDTGAAREGAAHTFATVRSVIDGDTIELADGTLVRYIGVDTPEMRKRQGRTWISDPEPFAEEATRANTALVLGKQVRLVTDVQRSDDYRRLLAYVYAGDTFVNAELLSRGLAVLLTIPPNVAHADEFVALQKDARERGVGLWAAGATETVTAETAHQYIGQRCTVTGTVRSVTVSKKAVFINFGKDYRTDFTAVIFKKNLQQFTAQGINPAKDYARRTVRIFGTIKEYNGPEIILDHPSQITVVGDGVR